MSKSDQSDHQVNSQVDSQAVADAEVSVSIDDARQGFSDPVADLLVQQSEQLGRIEEHGRETVALLSQVASAADHAEGAKKTYSVPSKEVLNTSFEHVKDVSKTLQRYANEHQKLTAQLQAAQLHRSERSTATVSSASHKVDSVSADTAPAAPVTERPEAADVAAKPKPLNSTAPTSNPTASSTTGPTTHSTDVSVAGTTPVAVTVEATAQASAEPPQQNPAEAKHSDNPSSVQLSHQRAAAKRSDTPPVKSEQVNNQDAEVTGAVRGANGRFLPKTSAPDKSSKSAEALEKARAEQQERGLIGRLTDTLQDAVTENATTDVDDAAGTAVGGPIYGALQEAKEAIDGLADEDSVTGKLVAAVRGNTSDDEEDEHEATSTRQDAADTLQPAQAPAPDQSPPATTTTGPEAGKPPRADRTQSDQFLTVAAQSPGAGADTGAGTNSITTAATDSTTTSTAVISQTDTTSAVISPDTPSQSAGTTADTTQLTERTASQTITAESPGQAADIPHVDGAQDAKPEVTQPAPAIAKSQLQQAERYSGQATAQHSTSYRSHSATQAVTAPAESVNQNGLKQLETVVAQAASQQSVIAASPLVTHQSESDTTHAVVSTESQCTDRTQSDQFLTVAAQSPGAGADTGAGTNSITTAATDSTTTSTSTASTTAVSQANNEHTATAARTSDYHSVTSNNQSHDKRGHYQQKQAEGRKAAIADDNNQQIVDAVSSVEAAIRDTAKDLQDGLDKVSSSAASAGGSNSSSGGLLEAAADLLGGDSPGMEAERRTDADTRRPAPGKKRGFMGRARELINRIPGVSKLTEAVSEGSAPGGKSSLLSKLAPAGRLFGAIAAPVAGWAAYKDKKEALITSRPELSDKQRTTIAASSGIGAGGGALAGAATGAMAGSVVPVVGTVIGGLLGGILGGYGGDWLGEMAGRYLAGKQSSDSTSSVAAAESSETTHRNNETISEAATSAESASHHQVSQTHTREESREEKTTESKLESGHGENRQQAENDSSFFSSFVSTVTATAAPLIETADNWFSSMLGRKAAPDPVTPAAPAAEAQAARASTSPLPAATSAAGMAGVGISTVADASSGAGAVTESTADKDSATHMQSSHHAAVADSQHTATTVVTAQSVPATPVSSEITAATAETAYITEQKVEPAALPAAPAADVSSPSSRAATTPQLLRAITNLSREIESLRKNGIPVSGKQPAVTVQAPAGSASPRKERAREGITGVEHIPNQFDDTALILLSHDRL
ncbi:MAG: hypothetical protein OIF57_06640 [Marinobacterium sp.]|nr:hypothetical protein [Marinobacterium sp.]